MCRCGRFLVEIALHVVRPLETLPFNVKVTGCMRGFLEGESNYGIVQENQKLVPPERNSVQATTQYIINQHEDDDSYQFDCGCYRHGYAQQ